MDEADHAKDKSTAEIEAYLEDLKRDFWKSIRQPKFVLEALGFLVLAVYTFFTALMYCANRSSADTAAKALRENTKAFEIDEEARFKVSIQESGWDQKMPNVPLVANYHYANVGKTPGEIIGIDKHVALIPFTPDVTPLTFPSTTPEAASLNPTYNGDDKLFITATSDSFPIKDYQQQIPGKMLIASWGCIEYRDIFQCVHWTDFCDVRQPAPNDSGYAGCAYRCQREDRPPCHGDQK